MNQVDKAKGAARFDAGLIAGVGSRDGARVKGRWTVTCRGRDGQIKWVETIENLIVNEGLNYLLDVALSGGAQITTWYVGLKGTGTPAAGDTLVSHASWSELNPYSGNRPAWVDGGVSGQSVDNSASKASFAITSSTTVYGAFLASVNTGTSGTLYAAGDFATSRAVQNGDTLEVTATFTMADDGV